MELIDISVINGGLNYVINNQDDESGVIPIIGRVHNFRLLVQDYIVFGYFQFSHTHVLILSSSLTLE